MSVLEIIFIISIIAVLIMWIWFIILGFKANKLWGFGVVFLFPVSPFIYAYRFARRSRKTIYYYIFSLAFFILVQLYIYFATVEFYPQLSNKIIELFPKKQQVVELKTIEPDEELQTDEKAVEIDTEFGKLNDVDIDIGDDVDLLIEKDEDEVEEEVKPVYRRSYKVVDIKNIGRHINRKTIITTTSGEIYKGKIVGVESGRVEVKIRMSGGFMVRGISHNKISKIEVYL